MDVNDGATPSHLLRYPLTFLETIPQKKSKVINQELTVYLYENYVFCKINFEKFYFQIKLFLHMRNIVRLKIYFSPES